MSVSSDNAMPVALANEAGQGKVIYALPIVDASAAEVAADREARDRWQQHTGMLEEQK